jgi:hypothetical protein
MGACPGPPSGARSVPKRSRKRLRADAALRRTKVLKALLRRTSRHIPPAPATSLKQSGGLEVPGSNPGAPTKRKPRGCEAFVFLIPFA